MSVKNINDSIMYLSSNCVEYSNDAWQTTAKGDANQAGQNDTKDGKEDIKCQKNNSQPIQIQKRDSFSYHLKFKIHQTVNQY